MYRLRQLVALIAILATGSGCSSQVTLLDPSVPEPLIDKLPMRVAGRYPDNFDHYVHEERVVGKEKWTINLGASHKILFTQLFSSMFTDYQVIGADTDPQDLGLDALIEPSIDAFEFSVPHQSQTDEFAVWIRYRIKIYDGAGTEVANWPLSAYGKAQTTTFGGDGALRRAAVLAMRDAAALMIMQMDRATGISKLNEARRAAKQIGDGATAEPLDGDVLPTSVAEEPGDEPG